MKTLDFDIRAALVRRMLADEIPRANIRHELTLDTSSSGGRADVVILNDARIVTVEIKSGSDRLDRLEQQVRAFRRTFDGVCVVADARHSEKLQNLYLGDRVVFDRSANDPFRSPYGGPAELQRALSGSKGWGGSTETSPIAMASLMWASEAMHVAAKLSDGGRTGTRVAALAWLQENASLAQLRPLIIAELRARPHSLWEQTFWRRFDGEAVAA